LGIENYYETFGDRNRIERFFRELKNWMKMFYNDVNIQTLKCVEEIVAIIIREYGYRVWSMRVGYGNTIEEQDPSMRQEYQALRIKPQGNYR